MKIYRIYVMGDGRPYWAPGGAGYTATVIKTKRREYEIKDGYFAWAFFAWIAVALVLDLVHRI